MNPPRVVLRWFKLLVEAFEECPNENIKIVLNDLANILFYDPPSADELRKFVVLYEEYREFLEKREKEARG